MSHKSHSPFQYYQDQRTSADYIKLRLTAGGSKFIDKHHVHFT
jgi:hypothetical protein